VWVLLVISFLLFWGRRRSEERVAADAALTIVGVTIRWTGRRVYVIGRAPGRTLVRWEVPGELWIGGRRVVALISRGVRIYRGGAVFRCPTLISGGVGRATGLTRNGEKIWCCALLARGRAGLGTFFAGFRPHQSRVRGKQQLKLGEIEAVTGPAPLGAGLRPRPHVRRGRGAGVWSPTGGEEPDVVALLRLPGKLGSAPPGRRDEGRRLGGRETGPRGYQMVVPSRVRFPRRSSGLRINTPTARWNRRALHRGPDGATRGPPAEQRGGRMFRGSQPRPAGWAGRGGAVLLGCLLVYVAAGGWGSPEWSSRQFLRGWAANSIMRLIERQGIAATAAGTSPRSRYSI